MSTKIGQAPRVVVMYHTTGLTHSAFTRSLAHALIYEGGRVEDVVDCPSPYVVEARNSLVGLYLKRYRSLWLLMVDADMEFPEDAISRSLHAAMQNQIPVLCGDYAQGNEKHSLFVEHEETGMLVNVQNVKSPAIYRNIAAGGTGWMLIRRDVLEEMRLQYKPYHWFDRDLAEYDPEHPACSDLVKDLTNERGLTKLGEDVSFCRRATALGYEVAGHTGLELIHHKSKGTVHLDYASLFTDRDDVVVVGGKFEETEEDQPDDRSGAEPDVLQGRERAGTDGGGGGQGSPGGLSQPGADADATGHP